jgi:hypothetical protein
MTSIDRVWHRAGLVLVLLLCGVCFWSFSFLGCGNDDANGVNPEDKLCRGQSGFGARIAGGTESIEMCVPDQATLAYYVPIGDEARYEIRASFTTGGLTIEILVHFYVQPTYPMTLSLTANAAQADSDPGSVWFYYEETKDGDYDYVGVSVTGVFTVTFNDPSIAVASFSGLEIQLEDNSTGDPAGVRTISEGYVNVSAD